MVAGGFAERKVGFAVNGNGAHSRLVGQNGCRAVSLVHVQVKHGNAFNIQPMHGVKCADGEIVEHAISRTKVSMCVVRTTGHVAADTTVHDGVFGGFNSPTC